MIEEAGGQSKVKCLVWDLDDTIWDGILLEDQRVALKEGVRETIAELDRRGILQSIASRNSLKAAEARLMELDIWDYFCTRKFISATNRTRSSKLQQA